MNKVIDVVSFSYIGHLFIMFDCIEIFGKNVIGALTNEQMLYPIMNHQKIIVIKCILDCRYMI